VIRIHVAYQSTDEPWGGANNFIRALRAELMHCDRFTVTDTMDEDCDILFMNQLTVGPGRQIPLSRVLRFRRGESTVLDRLRGRATAKASSLVVRAVNLYGHAFRMGVRNALVGRARDARTMELLHAADLVVFQSDYQRRVFVESGYSGSRNRIIHNGASRVFWADPAVRPRQGDALRLVASTASPRATKRHDLIAALSEIAGVEVLHFGNWPAGLSAGRVQRFGMVPHAKMAEVFKGCDYFFHPAVKDPCPNAVFEAIVSGLPVIYHPGAGSSAEVVGPNGLPLDERDLAGTVDRARSEHEHLRSTVMQNREYYTVQRATREYVDAFEAVSPKAAVTH